MSKLKWLYYIFILTLMIGIPVTIFHFFDHVKADHSNSLQVTVPTLRLYFPDNSPKSLLSTEPADQLQIPDKSPTSLVMETSTQTIEKTVVPTITLKNPPPELWKEWSVMPNYVSDELKQLYQNGIDNGNNPQVFSIFGDCHSLPEVFLGIYDRDPDSVNTMTPSIKETVINFKGSFDRYSPTVKDGTTEGALLWPLWNDNKERYCNLNENPVDCEIRVHNPSIVFIRVGTHYETRNERYLIRIIENLLENGIVPIIVTKADNRELDERINETLVRLAAQYDLPVWNFWASVQHLDNQGVNPKNDMNLTDEAYNLQKIDGIRVLDFVWHQLNQ